MLDLESAIKHAEKVASRHFNDNTDCINCAEEHKQLAEWLKELKELKRILYASEYVENGITYSYCYDNDSRVKHMRHVSKEI